jgi:hypothetical protein
MTSQINFNAVDITYPVAGQDNDSEGFRGNFAAIQNGLETAKSEISDLQAKAVLIETLGTETATVANDLLGSTIKNGLYSNFNGIVPDSGETTFTGSQHTIHFSGTSENCGALQVFKISQNSLITFANWRVDPVQFSSIRIHLISNGSSNWTVRFSNSGGTVVFDRDSGVVDETVTLIGYQVGVTDPVHTIVEAWTYDGDIVYMRSLGNFTSFGALVAQFGNVSLTGVLASTNATESTTTTTGAVKIAGGVGIVKNANIGGNLAVTGATDSTTITSGAVVVAGGVGIAKNLNVGGNVRLGNGSLDTVYITGDLVVEGNTSLSTTSVTIADINDITNVDTATALVASQVLKYNGTNWVNANNNVSDLADADIEFPATGDSLKYDAGTGKWTNNLDLVEYAVTVDDNGSGTQEVFFLDGTALKTSTGDEFGLEFSQGKKYRFDLSDVSNAAAPLRFSTTADTAVPASITPYTTNVTISGTAGTANAYIEILVTSDTPKILFVYGDEGGSMLDTSLVGAAYPISVGGYYFTGSEDLVSGSAASLGKTASYFTANTASTATLAAGKDGQTKAFMHTAGADSMVITVANPGWTGAGTITFDDVGQACSLQYINNKWFCIGNNGATFA